MPLPPISFPTLGWQIVDWMEAMLCHGPGDVAGDPFEVDDEIAVFWAWAYRVRHPGTPEAGRRYVHRAILSRPKGRAKSEHAGAWVCAEALGPVRFDHWAEPGERGYWGYEYTPGEPVGKPVRSPFIRCLATEEDQSGNTYDNVVAMLSQGHAADHFGLRMGREVGITRVFLPSGGEIRPSTASSASKDGGLESAAVADETHLYTSNALRAMYRTVARNTGKRRDAEPLMLDTTTAWQPGERSVAETAAERYAHLDPVEAVERFGVLYDHRQGPEPKRFGDDRSLIKAMREGYGPAAAWIDFRRIVKLIRDAEDPEAEAYRYWLNRPRAATLHWLLPAEIDTALTDEVPEAGTAVAVGFDGSETDDHTALIACTEGGLVVPIGIWAPADADADWRLDVDAAVRWAFEHYRVVRFYGDPPWWQLEMGRWAAEFSDPRRPGTLPVAEWWTNRDTPMAVACGALRTAIRQRDIRINPKPLLTDEQHRDRRSLMVWHFENARTRKVRVRLDDRAEEAYVVRKDRPGSPLKIDSVPATALAIKARDDAVKEGEFQERTFTRASW